MASRTSRGVLPVLRTDQSGFETAFRRLERRREVHADDVERSVRRILEKVQSGGDKELLAWGRRSDR
jgi:histidinol dehydrogenase